jgi:hypothetical protein
MGQECSYFFDDLLDSRSYDLRFAGLSLTKSEINRIYEVFRAIDLDGSGTIKLMELFVRIRVEPTPFSVRAFQLVDKDGSGHLDFSEFVKAVWNFCTLTGHSFGMKTKCFTV